MTDLTRTPLRVAFIGAGNMARLHLQALRQVGIANTRCYNTSLAELVLAAAER